MFGLFGKKKEESSASLPEWFPQTQENQQRFFDFLGKLEAKMQELCQEAIPTLKEMRSAEDYSAKMEFHRMKSAIDGQLNTIRKKAYGVREEKIQDLYSEISDSYELSGTDRDLLYQFRDECHDRYTAFENRYSACSESIAQTDAEDYEKAYQRVLDEYALIKDKFSCKQCASPIAIEKIFFTDVYLNCPACQTQNTFIPSTQAKMVQNFARNLAHQRVADLYEKYKIEAAKERDYYYEMHPLKLSLHFEKNSQVKAETEAKVVALEAARQTAIQNTPLFHAEYVRAMYTQWKKITPDMEAHLDVRMQNELNAIND